MKKISSEPFPLKPKTRGDCFKIARPCPYVSCRYHLYLDVTRIGTLKIAVPNKDPEDVGEVLLKMEDTCALDAADKYCGMTLQEIGDKLYVSRERIRQIEKESSKDFIQGLSELVDEV